MAESKQWNTLRSKGAEENMKRRVEVVGICCLGDGVYFAFFEAYLYFLMFMDYNCLQYNRYSHKAFLSYTRFERDFSQLRSLCRKTDQKFTESYLTQTSKDLSVISQLFIVVLIETSAKISNVSTHRARVHYTNRRSTKKLQNACQSILSEQLQYKHLHASCLSSFLKYLSY